MEILMGKIHAKIVKVCECLQTAYRSKKHGGYSIYEDDRVYLCLDTYVPNVDMDVKLPNGRKERVFSRSYCGYQTTYHTGKWEIYLDSLYERALMIEQAKIEIDQKKQREMMLKEKMPASCEADKVFDVFKHLPNYQTKNRY